MEDDLKDPVILYQHFHLPDQAILVIVRVHMEEQVIFMRVVDRIDARKMKRELIAGKYFTI